MKKLTKIFLVAFATLFISSAAFADDFDWSECWCTYGAGIEPGDVIVDIGTGFPWSIFNFNSSYKNWFVPAIEATVEFPVMLGKLPFSFGGSFYYDAYGWSYTSNYWDGTKYRDFDYKFARNSFATGGLIKYHVHLPPKNLDLYAGLKLGIGFTLTSDTYWNASKRDTYTTTGNYWWFYHSEFLGATWYFGDVFGLNLEFGYPIGVKLGISLKF